MTSDHTTTNSGRGGAILLGLLGKYKRRVALLSVVSLASAMFEAFFLVLLTGIGTALVNGQATVGPAFGRSLSVAGALLIAAASLIFRVALSLTLVKISALLSAAVTTDQRQRLSHAYLRTSWGIQESEPAGRLEQLLTTFVARTTTTVSTLGRMITAGLSLLAFLGTGLLVDPLSTLVLLVALGVIGGVLTPIRRGVRRRSHRYATAGLEFAQAVSELGSLGLEMRTFGTEHRFEEHIDKLADRATRTQRRAQEAEGALPHIYISLAYGGVLAGVAALTSAVSVDLAVVGAVMLLMLRSISYGQQLSTASANIAASLPFLEQVEETVGRYLRSQVASGAVRPSAVTPFEARDVTFAYNQQRTALEGVTFRLEPGEALGVIGPSGAGKSTLAQLLLGLRQPTSGQLTSGGVALPDIEGSWWSGHVAFVPQEAKLATGTVAENIRFFRDGITDAALREAARQANILRDIEALPQGFDTHLGERGGQLSGGQRQRLSIARALVGRPGLLVLDEPTSALDGQSEALIRDALAMLRGQLSFVIIAHRMSTLDICDRIMVIEDGRMTALDTPTALRANNEFYRNALAVAGIA